MSSSHKARVEDDDDLDDLDDVIDQFSAKQQQPPPPAAASTATAPAVASASSTGATTTTTTTTSKDTRPAPVAPKSQPRDELDFDADFAAELARGMEALMSELGGPADGSGAAAAAAPEDETEEQRQEREKFKAAWEAMLVAGMNDMQGSSDLGIPVPDKPSGSQQPSASTSTSAAKATPAGGAKDFESILRSTREKLSEGERGLNPGTSSEGGDMDSLEQMLKQLQDLGGEDGDDFEGVLENMMGTLMSKDILYEPLKELVEKFPSYIQDNASKLSPEDKSRYESQLDRARQIIAVFDEPGYDDSNEATKERVVELMNQMQSFGAPPSELMGPLPSGLGLDGDGEGCTIA